MVTLCLCVTMCCERLHGHAIQRDHATPQMTADRALGEGRGRPDEPPEVRPGP